MSTAGCVVVGAGLSAANVVQTLREEGYDAPITLIGNEPDRPRHLEAADQEIERQPIVRRHLWLPSAMRRGRRLSDAQGSGESGATNRNARPKPGVCLK